MTSLASPLLANADPSAPLRRAAEVLDRQSAAIVASIRRAVKRAAELSK